MQDHAVLQSVSGLAGQGVGGSERDHDVAAQSLGSAGPQQGRRVRNALSFHAQAVGCLRDQRPLTQPARHPSFPPMLLPRSVGRLKDQMAEICVRAVLAVADLERRDVNLDLISSFPDTLIDKSCYIMLHHAI